MPKRWTVAVIGGGIGRSHIAEGYARMPDKFDLQVLCDLNKDRLAEVADEFAIPRRSTSFSPRSINSPPRKPKPQGA
jgi:predicted dehydrogenase